MGRHEIKKSSPKLELNLYEKCNLVSLHSLRVSFQLSNFQIIFVFLLYPNQKLLQKLLKVKSNLSTWYCKSFSFLFFSFFFFCRCNNVHLLKASIKKGKIFKLPKIFSGFSTFNLRWFCLYEPKVYKVTNLPSFPQYLSNLQRLLVVPNIAKLKVLYYARTEVFY